MNTHLKIVELKMITNKIINLINNKIKPLRDNANEQFEHICWLEAYLFYYNKERMSKHKAFQTHLKDYNLVKLKLNKLLSELSGLNRQRKLLRHKQNAKQLPISF